jgi:hypothetical protein
MNIVQTALVFVGIPLAFVAVVAAAVYGRAEIHQPNRYRPGRPWRYPPVWYLPHASVLRSGSDAGRAAIEGNPGPLTTAEGGASGEW